MIALTQTGALVLAAGVQAVAAVLVAVFTVRLVTWTRKLSDFTSDYVGEMRRLNDLQADANRIQAAVLSRQLQAETPVLTASARGYSASGERVESTFTVSNIGGSAALDVTVRSTWGDLVALPAPIQPGESDRVKVGRDRTHWTEGTAPEATEFFFTDPKGGKWRQQAGELPVESP